MERRTTGFMNHAGLIEKYFRVDFREIITRVTFSISIFNITQLFSPWLVRSTLDFLYFIQEAGFRRAVIAQLGERQTEDLKVPGSIPGRGIVFVFFKMFLIYTMFTVSYVLKLLIVDFFNEFTV